MQKGVCIMKLHVDTCAKKRVANLPYLKSTVIDYSRQVVATV